MRVQISVSDLPLRCSGDIMNELQLPDQTVCTHHTSTELPLPCQTVDTASGFHLCCLPVCDMTQCSHAHRPASVYTTAVSENF